MDTILFQRVLYPPPDDPEGSSRVFYDAIPGKFYYGCGARSFRKDSGSILCLRYTAAHLIARGKSINTEYCVVTSG